MSTRSSIRPYRAHGDTRALTYLLAAALVAGPIAVSKAAGDRPQPVILSLWTVLAGVMVLAARRGAAAPPTGRRGVRAAAAVRQLDDDVAEIRLNALRELAAIADEWPAGRQACVDAICTYLRRPAARGWPEPMVRRSAIALISAHLRPDARPSWRGLNLDLSGATIDGGSFAGAHFDNCTVDFTGAQFTGEAVLFSSARFTGATVHFTGADFAATVVDFAGARFDTATLDFANARHRAGTLDFSYAVVRRTRLSFRQTRLEGRLVDFFGARLDDSSLSFDRGRLQDGSIRLDHALIGGSEMEPGQSARRRAGSRRMSRRSGSSAKR